MYKKYPGWHLNAQPPVDAAYTSDQIQRLSPAYFDSHPLLFEWHVERARWHTVALKRAYLSLR